MAGQAGRAAGQADDKVQVCSFLQSGDVDERFHSLRVQLFQPSADFRWISVLRFVISVCLLFPLVTIAKDAAYRRGRITNLSYG
jgi:hypothetical protein